jgi:hypothetical protein
MVQNRRSPAVTSAAHLENWQNSQEGIQLIGLTRERFIRIFRDSRADSIHASTNAGRKHPAARVVYWRRSFYKIFALK